MAAAYCYDGIAHLYIKSEAKNLSGIRDTAEIFGFTFDIQMRYPVYMRYLCYT